MWYFQPSTLATADDEPQPSTMRQADIEEGVNVSGIRDEILKEDPLPLSPTPQSPVPLKAPIFQDSA